MRRKLGLLVHPDEFDSVWIAEAARRNVRYLSLHPVGGNKANESMAELLRYVQTETFCALRKEAEDSGLQVEFEMHAARYLLPGEEFSAHPEWFRMNADGERTADVNCCPSSEEALKYMTARAVEAAEILRPKSHRYYFWMDDSRDSACHCPKCREYSASDQQLIVMNTILSGLRGFDPSAKLSCLAYFGTADAPEKIRPADGIFLEFAPFDRERFRRINDPDCPKNVSELQTVPELLKVFGKKDARVLEYWLDNSMYSGWTKPPKAFAPADEIMKSDMDYYESLGFEEISTFACYLGPDYRALYGMADIGSFKT